MAGIVYNLLLLILTPVAVFYYLWRVFVSRKSRASWRENLGALPCLADRPEGSELVWLHAVSVGEVVASLPILDEIRRLMPGATILLTTITKTGNDMAHKSAKAADVISYLPLDHPLLINRAFRRIRPDALIIMEAEIWPILLATAKRRGVPIILANGIITDLAMCRGPVARWLLSWAYSNIDHCCMQTEDDAAGIVSLGARPETVRVLGSTKFDQEGAQLPDEAVQILRTDLGIPNGDRVFVAGSTNPGEDEPVMEAFKEMRNGSGHMRLILAPRQITRADEIQAVAESQGLSCARRSKKENLSSGSDVLILDTLGELARTYAVADITFVGGTLIPKGGHSLIQPILQGKPVFFGPHIFKTRDIAQMALTAGVGFRINDARELASQGKAMLSDVHRRADIDAACHRLVAENQGAAVRCARLVAGLLGVKVED